MIGKGKHIRTVPVPAWVKRALDAWTVAVGINAGAIFQTGMDTGKFHGAMAATTPNGCLSV